MKLWNDIKSVLPVSSRSFHSFEKEVNRQLSELTSICIKQAARLEEYKSHIDAQTERIIDQSGQTISRASNLLIEQNRLRMEAVFHDRYPNESAFEIRKRIFSNYPEAEGLVRLSQLANASMMQALHLICVENNLTYWFAYGTLVATLSRSGSIPWDDDIDICMMREDLLRLLKILETNDEWQVTTVFDQYVYCKQFRFCSRDASMPCFIDISIYDWASSTDPHLDSEFKKLRIDLMSELESLALPYWKERKWLFAPGSGYVAQCGPIDISTQDNTVAFKEISIIDSVINKYQTIALERGILCPKEKAKAVAYAIDNIYDAPWRRTLWSNESIFPPQQHAYEQYSFFVPAKAKEIADECYPGWPYLPKDILGHEHFQKEALKKPETQEKLSSLIKSF